MLEDGRTITLQDNEVEEITFKIRTVPNRTDQLPSKIGQQDAKCLDKLIERYNVVEFEEGTIQLLSLIHI